MFKGLSEREVVELMYEEWVTEKTPKCKLELKYLGNDSGNGKRFSNLVKKHLNIDTENRHRMRSENALLRAVLLKHGLDPDKELEIQRKAV